MNKIFDFNLEDSLKELKIFTNDLFSPDKESIPTAEDLQNLINNDPATFIDNYIKLIKKCNFYIDENQMRKQHMAKLLQSSNYDSDFRQRVIAFYNESDAYT